jgi:LemA protein
VARWLAVLLGLAVVFAVLIYNRLVTRRNRAEAAWSQIDVQLRRRHDLIPNLVAAVEGYMAHERRVFETMAKARAAALQAGDEVVARARAEAALSHAMRSILAIVETMPALKASTNMLVLQEELASTENRIALARQHYNDCVLDYNTALETVPSNIVARSFAFQPKVMFTAAADDQRPVAVVL